MRDREAPRRAHARRAPALRRLADRVGILAEYLDQTGREVRRTSDATRVALLAAMGIDASDEGRARQALAALDERDDRHPLRTATVTTSLEDALVMRVPSDFGPAVVWTLEVETEAGHSVRASGQADRSRRSEHGVVSLALPAPLAPGYHRLRVSLSAARGAKLSGEQTLIVTPPRCRGPGELLSGQRVFGLIASLYAVRSDRNWGVGDCTDLRGLIDWGRSVGAAFVGLNPLHALRNRGDDISPYRPVSRLFRNVVYLDVEAVPEFRENGAPARAAASEVRPALGALRGARLLDYEAVMAVKAPVLEALHLTFAQVHRGRRTARGDAYNAYRAREGPVLDDFATFCVLEERLSGEYGASWRGWPERYRDPRSSAVESFRAEHAERVDYHRWLQFELDRQLGVAAARAREQGLPIGVYQDLAIGSAPSGFDSWRFRSLFLDGASIGAPPDPYASEGQNWGLPPIDPRHLEASQFDYWIRLVRASMRHAGALRIDHVMGLFRQFWIPDGMSGKQGAFVRFPSEALLGILALESDRHGALVVGEDLGTVPKDMPPVLARWSVLSSKVLYFERDPRRGFRRPSEFPSAALTTANTHDMPTLAGFWRERDIDLRAGLGILDTRQERAARRTRQLEREDLASALAEEGLLPASDCPVPDVALRSAVHAYLRRTPSALVGLSLEDLIGETEPVNLPGVGPDRFPSWRRRLSLPIERFSDDPGVRRALGEERGWYAASQESAAGDTP